MSKNVDPHGARTENLQSTGKVFRVPIWLGLASMARGHQRKHIAQRTYGLR